MEIKRKNKQSIVKKGWDPRKILYTTIKIHSLHPKKKQNQEELENGTGVEQ